MGRRPVRGGRFGFYNQYRPPLLAEAALSSAPAGTGAAAGEGDADGAADSDGDGAGAGRRRQADTASA